MIVAHSSHKSFNETYVSLRAMMIMNRWKIAFLSLSGVLLIGAIFVGWLMAEGNAALSFAEDLTKGMASGSTVMPMPLIAPTSTLTEASLRSASEKLAPYGGVREIKAYKCILVPDPKRFCTGKGWSCNIGGNLDKGEFQVTVDFCEISAFGEWPLLSVRWHVDPATPRGDRLPLQGTATQSTTSP